MKKNLLFVLTLLCVSFSAFAQTFNTPAHLRVCDQDDDGIAVFDLTTTTSEIFVGLNPNDYVLSYHVSLEDTNADINPIPNPTTYTNLENFQEVYVRIEFSNGFGKVKFKLIAEGPIDVNPDYGLAQCDYLNFCCDGLTGFNLILFEDAIGYYPFITYDYYETQADADAGANPINANEIYYNTSLGQIIYVIITNQYGCVSKTEVALYAIPPPNPNTDTIFSVCDADGDGLFTVDLTNHESSLVDNPEIFSFEYYYSGTNDLIENPEAFSNATNPQSISVRVGYVDNPECNNYANFQVVADVNCGLIELCEDDNDGSTTFDLTQYETTYLNGQDPSEYNFQYYLNEADANASTNPIATPTSFVNTENPQSVYLGATEISTSNYQVVRISLEVNSNPLADLETSYTQCDGETIILDSNVDPNLYNILWSTSETTPSINVTSSGDYTLNITGIENSCSYSKTFNVIAATPLTANILATQEVCGWLLDFDLTSSEFNIIGNQTNVTLSYYNTIADAENSLNTIQNASTYTFSSSGSYTFYVRVDSNTTDCFVYVPLEFSVVDELELNSAILFKCQDPSEGDYVFNLDDAIPDIIGSQTLSVTFHETELEATQGINAMPSAYITALDNQILYARSENSASCFGVTTLELYGTLLYNLNTISDLEACSEFNDGFSTFYLTDRNVEILGSNDPNYFGVQYFETQADADSGVNPIPLNYTNIVSNVQTIYARVFSYFATCYHTTSFNLVVIDTPVVPMVTTVIGCYNPTLSKNVFDLDSSIPEIINGQADLVVTFHESVNDAENNVGPISSPYSVQIPLGLYARVENIVTGCYSTVVIVFNSASTCVSMVACGEAPVNVNYCYISNYDTQRVYESSNGAPLQIIINAGEVEIDYDQLIVLDSDGVTNLNDANPYGNTGDLSGLTFTSSGSSMTIYIDSDGDIDCSTEGYTALDFTIFCENTIGFIEVNAFFDDNNDGVFNANETAFNNGYISYEVNNDGIETSVNSNVGSFTLYNSDEANSYDISLNPNVGYNSCYNMPVLLFENISVLHGETTVVNFPITIKQSCEDLAVYLVPVETPRPGFNYLSQLVIENLGTTTISSGSVVFVHDALVDLDDVITTSPNIAIAIDGTGFQLDFTGLAPQTSERILIDLYCPVDATLGESVTNSANYTTNLNDVTPSNDSSSLTQIIMGSYDPNDISEIHGGKIVIDDFTNDDYLYYTINFQNLGNADALTVRIEDVLNSQLDETSFTMLMSSHDYVVTRQGNELTWQFNNINLPPEVTDVIGSKGYVYFKIKPNAGFAFGDIIPNTADIYFDANAAIITNTFNTEFFATLSSNEFSSGSFEIYPNPAKHVVTISFAKILNEVVKVSIYDIQGKLVLSTYSKKNEINTQINIEALENGMYFVKLKSKSFENTKKLIIE